MNIAQLLQRSALVHGERPAVLAGAHPLHDYRQLAARVAALAGHLRQRCGVRPGERVAIFAANCPEYLEALHAIHWCGAVSVPVNYKLHARELAHVLGDSGARVVCVSAELRDAAFAAGADPAALQVLAGPVWQQAAQGAPLVLQERAPQDLASLFYTSGTTGRPKGVLKPLWPASLRGQADPEALGSARTMAMGADTVYLSPAPLYHAAPLRYTLRVLELGGRAVIMERFDAATALALIESQRVTHSQWVPTMFGRLLKLPEEVRRRHDLSSHRLAIHAAAPCPVDVKRAMLDWWGDILMEYYAGSEGCGTTMITSQEWRARAGSVGRATTGQLHIVDDAGQELPAGEIGQVYFSGGGQFSYLNDAEKTRQAINERGWVTYGDIGHVDAEGYLYLSDRRADLILSGGVNLYPQEIENALARHADVQEVAVVGVPHPDFGEVPLAVVVLRPGAPASAQTARAIGARAAEVLARLKLPQRMVFVDSLPRLETGKLLRRKLKERYRDEPQAGHALRDS